MTTPGERFREPVVAPGFESVAAEFFRSVESSTPGGAALTILVEGEVAVDLWGGRADAPARPSWSPDTLAVVFSCSKALTALVVARLVERGTLSYSMRVADFWPEFAAHGKADVTLADALAHRSGLSAPQDDMTLDHVLDWGRATDLLARQRPLWTPGTGHQYHSITFGWIVGELVRRATGVGVDEHLARDWARPLGVDAWMGVPTTALPRVARATSEESPAQAEASRAAGTPLHPSAGVRALTLGGAFPASLVDGMRGFNDPRVHQACLPGVGAIASSRALATIMSASATPTGGMAPLSDSVLDAATQPLSTGRQAFRTDGPWSTWGMGFRIDDTGEHYLSRTSFGHDGAGGQMAFADTRHKVGFAYVTNRLRVEDTRVPPILAALRRAI